MYVRIAGIYVRFLKFEVTVAALRKVVLFKDKKKFLKLFKRMIFSFFLIIHIRHSQILNIFISYVL